MEKTLHICVWFMGLGLLVLALLLCLVCRRDRRHTKELSRLRQKKEMVEELNRQTRELAHHQRLQTIGTLTASISHEFNNLLTPIMGYSMMALEKIPPEDEELYDSIVEIYESSRKAKTLVSRLADLSRKNSETCFRPLSPDEVIRRTLDMAEPARREDMELKLDLNCWEQRISANEIALTQLMLNLILNAFHAMEEGGGTLTIRSSFDEGSVRLAVSDTGCGIPGELRERIFEPFFTTRESGRGTGLGLAIAAQVVEDHNGTIAVESAVGEGTTFTVTLPRV